MCGGAGMRRRHLAPRIKYFILFNHPKAASAWDHDAFCYPKEPKSPEKTGQALDILSGYLSSSARSCARHVPDICLDHFQVMFLHLSQ